MDTLNSSDDDHDGTSVARFAADLRRLRLEADSPTLTRLQHDTGISRSVISDAFAGRQLPSALTVDRIVRACGGDSIEWTQRRDAIAAAAKQNPELATPAATGAVSTVEAPAATTTEVARESAYERQATVTRRTATLIGAGGFFAGAAGAVLAMLLVVPLLAPSAPAEAEVPDDGPLISVENGTDPANTECVDDAAVATGDTRADNSLLEIVWSDKCQAGWGRITRYDGLGSGNTVTIAIYPQTAPDGPGRQEATEHDVQGAYTTLVVRPSPDTLLCAEGSFTVDGKRIDLGDPLCI